MKAKFFIRAVGSDNGAESTAHRRVGSGRAEQRKNSGR